MKIDSVEIKNFRSIKNVTLDFRDRSPLILIGMNESGKSNILKALNLLGDGTSTKEDIRCLHNFDNGTKNDESFVKFNFTLDKIEINQLIDIINKYFDYFKLFSKEKIVTNGFEELTLSEFCVNVYSGVYMCDLKNNFKNTTVNESANKYKVIDGWFLTTEEIEVVYKSEKFLIPENKLIYLNEEIDIEEDSTEIIEIDIVIEIIKNHLNQLFIKLSPKCLLWSYNEKYLLPTSININNFCKNPDMCLPLKNMFLIAGVKEISNEINNRINDSNSIRNLLERVAIETTKYVKNVWKSTKKITFTLYKDGDQIVSSIRENNNFDMSQRSDGFKRFVVFMLMVSSMLKKGMIKNTFLLLDEPDIGLDVYAKECLRDELKIIADKNYVVYSTHSIHMVDGDDVNRHLKVERKNEITTITRIDNSTIVNEETLYQVLGYSIFQSIKKNNIIFEGYYDKILFCIAIKNIPENFKTLNKFSNVGICHAKGAQSFAYITPILELAKRNIAIISDADKPAKSSQKSFDEKKLYGTWYRYDEFSKELNFTKNKVTAEDFLKNEYVAESFKKCLKDLESSGKCSIDLNDFNFNPSNGYLESIEELLKKNGIKQESDQKETVLQFKEMLFNKLEPENISEDYYRFLQALLKKLKIE